MPTRVLFLARSESSVKMDERALRALGVSSFVRYAASSSSALQILAKECRPTAVEELQNPDGATDLVVCDEQLGDAPATVFLYAMAKDPVLRRQPVLVLSSSPASTRGLRAAGVYVLERPYTPRDLARMVQKALSPLRRVLRPDIFERAAQRKDLALRPKKTPRDRTPDPGPMTTSDWFRKGQEHLEANNLAAAGEAFARVLRRQEDHAGACLGMARVCRARKDRRGMRRALIRAAAAYARQGDRARADAIVAVLPESVRDNLFLHEAIAFMEEGEYRPAALSFLDAGRENPGNPLHRVISRACLLMPKPEESMAKLCDAYAGLGHQDTAHVLRRRLLSYVPYEEQGASSWLDRYPGLKEAVSVVGYAAWAWRQA
jgi:CheY-like chemotaxis protein